ncbi:MAG: ABC transporter permease [Actinomycetota bacterium]|nr:ABC transporter permease [Actinomycetota bacterium]
MTAWAPGALAPAPATASRGAMLAAQTRAELTLMLRNGEQVLLTMVIPLGLLVGLTLIPAVTVDGRRVDFFVPGIIALAVMSTAFTGQAIATGFDRQYGVLKRLGATPLPRSVLLQAKTLAVLSVELVQLVLLCSVGRLLGWHPHGDVVGVLVFVVLGTAAFAGLGLLLGGTLPGLTTLAVANLLWLVLLALGGVVFPLHEYGAAVSTLLCLPSAALADGLREVLQHGAFDVRDAVTLVVWAVVGLSAASRWFRWE